MTGARSGRPVPVRVRTAHVEWVAERLSERDWTIIEIVNRLRIVSGQHLDSLVFYTIPSERSRTVTRSRVLLRLAAWRVLVPLARRVGGQGRGSSVQLYALDTAGQRLLAQRQAAAGSVPRVRRPGTPGERMVRHVTAVAELYAALVTLGRVEGFTVQEFSTEPACWWRNGLGGYVKPDAYVLLTTGAVRDHWWAEIDLASESLPTIHNKLLVYLDFLRRGQLGPGDVMPRVLISTVTEQRRDAIRLLVRRLPAPAGQLFAVMQAAESPRYLCSVLRQ
jgi:hypothetical protein